ncbi:GNAT family N-acetyltransferase [Polaribacter sp. L3A8]|uniref:GNAT family N-acetyltransferase n=1 Tax=Polaribacter sp. L3A8 TaxID=2686361 RepID=UPI00131B05D0|nr:GNAT family N-acetyltransferase [Polaribacter sp. L3A8]
MNIKIIEGKIELLEPITQLYNEYMLFYKQPSNIPKYRAYLKDRMLQDNTIFCLAVDANNNAVGFTQNFNSYSSLSLHPILVLNDLFVSSNYRRKGIAEMLIKKTFQLAKKANMFRVDLRTSKDNTGAQKLYNKMNFIRDENVYTYRCEL